MVDMFLDQAKPLFTAVLMRVSIDGTPNGAKAVKVAATG
jgi:hypothetical protein